MGCVRVVVTIIESLENLLACGELIFDRLGILKGCVATPNDPKLSNRRGWRDGCAAKERRRLEAAGVTAAPVR